MRSGTTIARSLALGGAALALAGGALVTAPTAVATSAAPVKSAPSGEVEVRGKDCSITGCSEIENRSKRKVRVGRDWCGDSGSPSVGEPSCGAPSKKHPNKWLEPGEHSHESTWHDTDTFGITGGCTMKVQWNHDGEEGAKVKTYTPSKTTWYKVSNNHDIDIESYKCL